MALTQGSHLGPYEITAVIGSGGMGDVYRARDHRLGRDIAIKVVSETTASDPVSLSRFTREAHAVAALNHPHIVTIFSIEEADGTPFITMELVEGRTLARMIPEGGLSLSQFFDISMAMADALSAAHHKHITHRDLTPVNVMVTSEGLVKVLDFGLARGAEGDGSGPVDIEDMVTQERLTGAGTILGTMPYMSPEQIEAKPLDPRTDIFSFGIVMYEMATGGRPFQGDTRPALMASIMREHERPVSELRRDLPAEVSRLIGRCLEKDPHDRVQTAHEILLELRSMRRAWESGATAPTPKPGAASPWPWVAGVAIAASLAVVGLRAQRPPPSGVFAARAAVTRLIVVLPFENITRNPTDQVLADGLFETLPSSLIQLERFQRTLRVVPASDVRKERVASAREAHRTFGALLAISGSIQRFPTVERLTFNLVDAVQLGTLASRTIDITDAADGLTQDMVVRSVAALLGLAFEPETQKALTAGGTEVQGAYDLFVRGRGYLPRFDVPENTDQAIELLGRAVAKDPRYALAHTALAEAYWRKYGSTRQASWIDQATSHCEKALAIDNRLAPVHVTLAMIARGRGRYEQALTYALTAVELDPVRSEGYRELGAAYEELEQAANAEATYQKAVEARPDDWLAYNLLGAFFLSSRRWTEAEAAFRRVLELAPDNTKGFNNLGATFFNQGRTDEGAAWWEKSMLVRPTNTAASNLGSYYYSHGRYRDASRAYERAIEISPSQNYQIWVNLGAALFWTPGERSKASAAYVKAVKLAEGERRVNPREPEILANLADSYSILGRRAEARAAVASVERLEARDPGVLFRVANACEQMDERARALQWLEKAIAAGHDRASIERSPWLEALRKDERFVQMMRKSNH